MKNTHVLLILSFFLATINQSFSQSPTLELDKVLIQSTQMGQPWGMSFISSDELLFTEKSGELFSYKISTNTKTQISGTPTVAAVGQGGLLDVAIHPDFASNKYVYLSYSISGTGGYTLAVGRGVLENNQLVNFAEIFRALPFKSGTGHFGSRLAFDAENHIYFSSSERQESENAQILTNHLGKTIRLNDDGSVPSDNPFVGQENTKPEIYTYGHRNIQGLVIHPVTGKVYAHEHGPRGGDELNLINPSKNYGWPSITFGIDYDGTIISEDTAKPGMEQPIRYWVPSIAPCGMAIVPLQNQLENEVNFIVGALAGTQIQWVKINNDKHVETYSYMHNYARFRDVEVAPDGKIYALTESPNSLILLKTNALITNIKNEEELVLKELIFPNPIETTLTFLNTDHLNYKIISLEGEIVQESIINGGKIELANLKSGMFLINVEGYAPKKFMKK